MIKPVQLLQESPSDHLRLIPLLLVLQGFLCWKQHTSPVMFVLSVNVLYSVTVLVFHTHSLKNKNTTKRVFCSDVAEEPFLVLQTVSGS